MFLCTNLGNGPAGTQACPPPPATIRGTIRPADVIGPATQGIEAGEFGELLDAIDAGVTYVNVHSTQVAGRRDPRPARRPRTRSLIEAPVPPVPGPGRRDR